MSSSVSDENLEKKFQGATNTQDSIQTLSLWLLHHKAHHQKIVAAWMKVLQKAKINHRLTLFYLANDVIQNGKRKGFVQFGNSFAEVLREATLLVRDDQIRTNVERVFSIWENRNVYSSEFIAELLAILANSRVPATAPSKLLAEFKPENVIEKIKTVTKLGKENSTKIATVNLNKLNAKKTEIVQQLKDRTHGQQFKKDFDASFRSVEELIKVINHEVKERTELILLLEQSEIYYDTQRGEAKIVANAYKNFGARVKTLQKKLSERIATFPSPLSSPCPDAPSPTTSDHDLELMLPNDKSLLDEIENLADAPSPVGSPEGLNLSPEHKDVKTNSQPVSSQNVGNPIPTLSNFFTHEQSGMSSWLDAFSNKNKIVSEKTEAQKSDPNSLESRLSNLLQNIPNLPTGLPTSLFNNASSGNNTPLREATSSPISIKKEKSESVGIDFTSTKDEYSGQNTPLQDEDTHSSHAFFTKLASSNKTHSPKDILKGLTNLIQSAANEKNDEIPKNDVYFDHSDSYKQANSMPSFIAKTLPSVCQASHISSSPSSYFSSPQPGLPAPVRTLSTAQTSTVNSYQTVPNDNVPSYSTKPMSDQNELLSYIPSLVPSTPLDTYGFVSNTYSTEEYNPEMGHFDTDMDIENAVDDRNLDMTSPQVQAPEAVIDEMPRSIGGRRLSTLITVVTKDSPNSSLPSNLPYSSDVLYKKDTDIRIQNPSIWEDNSAVVTSSAPILPQSNVIVTSVSSPNEEFFIGKEAAVPNFYTSVPPPPLPSVEHEPINGQSVVEPLQQTVNTNLPCPLSQIETVQSHREDINGQWYGNNWSDNDMRIYEPESPPIPPPMPNNVRMPPRFFDDERHFSPNFHPRNNWMPRNRHEHLHSHHPYRMGPPINNKRFPFRGRGWGRQKPRY